MNRNVSAKLSVVDAKVWWFIGKTNSIRKWKRTPLSIVVFPGGFLNAEVRILNGKGVAPDATCAEDRRFGCGVAN